MGELIQKRMKGKANTNGLDKNKGNINKNGRPKRGVRLLNEKIKEKIGTTLTKSEINDMILGMLDLTQEEINEIANNKESSTISSIIAKELLKDEKSFFALNVLLDRGIGKPLQKVESKNLNVNINPLEDRLKELGLH